MPSGVESNLIIRTRVPKPDSVPGFQSVKRSLDSLKKQLTEITSHPWQIKVAVDIEGIGDLNQLAAKVRKAVGDSNAAAGAGVPAGAPGTTGTGGAEDRGTRSRRRFRGGQFVTTGYDVNARERTEDTQNDIRTTYRRKRSGAFVPTAQTINSEPYLPPELSAKQAEAAFRAKATGPIVDVLKTSKGGGTSPTAPEGIVKQFREATQFGKNLAGQALILEERVLEVDTVTGKWNIKTAQNLQNQRLIARELKQQAVAAKAVADHQARTANFRGLVTQAQARGEQILGLGGGQTDRFGNRNQFARFSTTDPTTGERTRHRFSTLPGQEHTFVGDIDPAHTALARQNTRRFRAQQQADRHATDAAGAGFHEGDAKTQSTVDRFGVERQNQVRQFTKVATEGFGKYVVAVRSVNEATGTMEEKILRGAAATRFLGDSFTSAVGKVLIWTGATTAVFGTIAALKQAVSTVSDLEKGTVLLERVGRNLGGAKEAKELTAEIVKQTTIFGGDAVAAQKSATVFLRAGQTKKEALQSVTAALLATKIAELDEVQAAELLSAAQLQFRLTASELIPTLDTLNDLSNHYRVSTDDLLQSISRTGSVVEEQGGRLSELAAITAVVAQRTTRSGTEIGNAIKTISSRLVSSDVQSDLFKTAGVQLRNLEGDSRSLSEVLLDLKNSFATLSEAERDSLTVQIAGVRQRNLLIAAVNGSIDSVVAEIDALQNIDSAQQEFQLNTNTLSSTLERLKNTLIDVVNGGFGPISGVLKPIVNTLTSLIGLLTTDVGQVIGTLAGLATVFALIVVTMHKLIPLVVTAGSAILSLGGATVVVTGATTASVPASLSAARAYYALGTAAKFTQLTLSAFNPITLVATGALLALTYGISSATQKETKYAEAIKRVSDETADAATTAKKRATAVEVGVKAIVKELNAIDRLSKIKTPQAQDRIDEIKSEIEKIAQAAGIKIPVRFDPQNAGDVKKFAAELANAELNSRTDLISKKRLELAAKEEEVSALAAEHAARKAKLDAQKQQRADYLNPAFRAANAAGNPDPNDTTTFTTPFRYEFNYLDEYIYKLQDELRATSGQLGNAKDKARSLKEEVEAIGGKDKAIAELGNKYLLLSNNLNRSVEAAEKFHRELETNQAVGDLLGVSKVVQLTDAFTKQQAIVQAMDRDYMALGKAINDPAIAENIIKNKDEMLKFARALELAKVESEIASRSVILGGQSDVLLTRGVIEARRNRQARFGDEGEAGDLLDKIAERDILKRQVGNLAGAAPSDNPAEMAARHAQLAELLVQLRNKEFEIAKQVYLTDEKIADARKKSADETLRSIGALSDEDKLVFNAQLSRFEKNPNDKLTFQQFQLLPQNIRSVLEKFFADRIEFGPNDPGAQRALKTVRTPEQLAAERAASAARDAKNGLARGGLGGAGASADDVADAQGRAAAAAENQLRNLRGEQGINIDGNITNSVLNNNNFNVDITANAQQFEAIVNAFQKVAIARYNELALAVNNRLDKLESQINTKPPGRAAPN